MKKHILPRWLRVNCFTAPRFWDALCALADRGGAGLRRLLNRCIDLDDFRSSKPSKRTYLPEVLVLEKRMLPSLTINTGTGINANVGVPMTLSQSVATVTDTSGDLAPSAYSATITWGDGATTIGVVYSVSGTLNVSGYHTYLQSGMLTYSVSVTGDSASGSNTGSADITPASNAAFVGGTNLAPAATLTFGSISYTLATGAVSDSESLGDNVVLNYQSGTVSVAPVIQFTGSWLSLPASVSARLTWNGTPQATVTYGTTGNYSADTLVLDLQTPTVSASGAYPWSLTVTPSGYSSVTYSGTVYVDVSSASEGVTAGMGWTIEGVDRLISTTGGVEWKDGNGNGRFFAAGLLGPFTSPTGDFGTLTQNMDGSYSYVGKGSLTTEHFNSSGYETGLVTADGLYTTITYSGSELTGIATPDGRFATFGYDGSGNLQSSSRRAARRPSPTTAAATSRPSSGPTARS